jgi:hypothetical protein
MQEKVVGMNALKFLRGIVAPFVALCFVSAASVHAAPAGSAVVESVTGMAWKVSPSGAMQPLAVGTVIHQGDTLKTGIDSQVEVALGNQARTVSLAANSTVRFEQLSIRPSVLGGGDIIQSLFKLERGVMSARADNFAEGSSFDVEMPGSLARARLTRHAPPQTLSALFDAQTGDIYNFSKDNIALTVVLDIEFSNSPQFPVGLNATTVHIPPGFRFVMPSLFEMKDFNSAHFAVSKIPNGVTHPLLLALGFQPMSDDAEPIAIYKAAVLELKVLNAKKRLGFAKFPPTLISY